MPNNDKALTPASQATPTNGQGKGRSWTAEQLHFIEWLSSPDRQPTTQEALAEQLHLHPLTLTKWKRIEGLSDAVIARTREMLRVDDVPRILHSHADRGMENVDSAKLVLHAANVLGDTHTDRNPTVQVLIVNQAEPGQEAIDAIAD